MPPLPDRVPIVIVGAGFAGAATAWALARRGCSPGIIVEQEGTYGFHASGRNAAILRLIESDPVIGTLAVRSARQIRSLTGDAPLLGIEGGLTLGGRGVAAELEGVHAAAKD